mmetsp:Transcript_28662/g.31831  ORF Transcript_28662/g.31831 Transcript_28662/m.31831 type:complete len:327 (-) Transcript_28662:39-1019(-)
MATNNTQKPDLLRHHRPWNCEKCGWWIYNPREKEGCNCDKIDGLQVPDKKTAYNKLPIAMQSIVKCKDEPASKNTISFVSAAKSAKKHITNIPDKAENAVRIVCVSDTHCRHKELEIPPADILIHAGDFTNSGRAEAVDDFVTWLDGLPVKHKIVISGNHDVTLNTEWYAKHYWRYHKTPYDAKAIKEKLQKHCTYLQDSKVTIEGLNFYGTPWVKLCNDWVFAATDSDLEHSHGLIPSGVDVIISHNPPQATRSVTSMGDCGASSLIEAVKRTKPKAVVFGHIHSGYGITKKHNVVYVNAASVNSKLRPFNKPVVFDIVRNSETE